MCLNGFNNQVSSRIQFERLGEFSGIVEDATKLLYLSLTLTVANYRRHSRLSVLANDVEGQDSGLSLYFDLQPAGFLVLAVRNREGVDTGAILKSLDRVCSCDMDE